MSKVKKQGKEAVERLTDGLGYAPKNGEVLVDTKDLKILLEYVKALEAVEGEIRAQALEDVAELVHDREVGLDTREQMDVRGCMQRHNRSAVAQWLKTRAEEERG